MEKIFAFFAGISQIIGSFLGLTSLPEVSNFVTETPIRVERYIRPSINPNDQKLGAINPVAGATYTLFGGGVTNSATSITLQSFTLPQTGQTLTTANVASTTGLFYITLEPGSRARQEIVSCTTVTQNTSGTATLSGCIRGLSPISPYTASTTLQFGHGGGTQVILSDPPQLFNLYTAKENAEIISGMWKFSSTTPPRYDQPPPNHSAGSVVATTSEFASVAYVNATGAGVNVSASTAVRGEVQIATRPQVASSTATGSTGAIVVVPASAATSTPGDNIMAAGGTGETYIAVTEDDGDLNPNYIATSTTDTYRFGANIFFNNATTSFNGVDFRYPSVIPSNMASGTVMYLNATTSTSGATFGFARIATSTRADTFIITSTGTGTSTPLIASYTDQTTSDTVYVKLKQIRVILPGTLNVFFELSRTTGSGTSAEGRIYRNDVAVGTERTTTATGPTMFNETISVREGDQLQIYAKQTGGATAAISVFGVSYRLSTDPILEIE